MYEGVHCTYGEPQVAQEKVALPRDRARFPAERRHLRRRPRQQVRPQENLRRSILDREIL